jgi:hypothetical protein
MRVSSYFRLIIKIQICFFCNITGCFAGIDMLIGELHKKIGE